MTALSPTYNKTYTVPDNAISWSLVKAGLTTQTPACGYIDSYSFSLSPAFNSANPLTLFETSTTIDFSLFTTDLADAGTKTLTLTSTLQNYNVIPAASAPTTSKTITVIILNPCDTATVSATPYPSFTTSVLVSASSSTPHWYDSYSGSAAN